MPESEFDKQVQREMEGLRLRPSAAVWENVEKELRRKKRRRILVVFWLLAGLGLLGYSSYFLTQKSNSSLAESSHAPATVIAKDAQQPGASDAPNAGNNRSAASPANPGSGAQSDQAPLPNDQASAGTTPAAPASSNELNDQHANGPAAKTTRQPTAANPNLPVSARAGNNKPRTAKDRATSTDRPSAPIEGGIAKGTRKNNKTRPAANTEAPAAKAPAITAVSTADQQLAAAPAPGETPATITDSVKANADSAVAAVEPPLAPAQVKAPVVKKRSSSAIDWSLDLAFGVSGPISSPFLIGSADKSLSDPQSQSGVNSPTSPITPPGSFGPVYTPRSDINPGPSFRIGILGEWAISKRTSIAAGLQYQYQSNNIRTGYYTDTALNFDNYASQPVSVNSLYRGGSQKTFTNRFHYLQVPVNFQWQVNSGKKLPLILHAGLAAGYLLTTNALAYDSLQGGVYYHDKNAFNRFQLSFNTGLSFRIGNNKAFQWSVGPEVSMGLRSQVKEEYDKKQYPLYLGIQARLYWPRKR